MVQVAVSKPRAEQFEVERAPWSHGHTAAAYPRSERPRRQRIQKGLEEPLGHILHQKHFNEGAVVIAFP